MTRKRYRDPRQRFLEVAEHRTNSVLERIRILSHCSNRQLYEYSPEEIQKIFRTIEGELQKAKNKFLSNQKRNKFRLR
jgi:hypothetical protein